MILEIDHLLVAVREPDAEAAHLADALGLPRAGGGVHAAIGTRNALLALGGPYLELIGPVDDAAATASYTARHPIGAAVLRALGVPADDEGTARGAFVTLALRSDDVRDDVARLRSAGSDIGDVSAVTRQRPDGSTLSWPVAFPPRLGPDEAPFVIEHAPDEPERAARLATAGPRLAGIRLAVADPGSVAGRWRRALGIAFDTRSRSTGGGRRLVARVGRHTIELSAPALGVPSAQVILAGARLRSPVDVVGVRFTSE